MSTTPISTADSRTVEYRRSAADPAVADPESARELLTIEDFASNHNGGLLLFGPDGELYLGMGDGGGAGDPERTAQDPDSPLGKLLRIDRERPGGYEVAALGLRNPWRYSFDSRTGDLWIGDVGQSELEEIDAATQDQLRARRPLNYGWSAFEGTEPLQLGPAGSRRARAGPRLRARRSRLLGHRWLRGPRPAASLAPGPLPLRRLLRGRAAQLQRRSVAASRRRRALGLRVAQLSSFGEDASGRIYAVSLAGAVYRLAPDG